MFKREFMHLTFAHFRNRFSMFRTYYALAKGLVKPDGFTISVVEVPDPPSDAQEKALIAGEIEVADLYYPNFLCHKIEGAEVIGIATEWKTTAKGNGIFVCANSPIQSPKDLAGCLIATHQGAHVVHRYILRHLYGVDDTTLRWASYPQEELVAVLKNGKADAVVLIDQNFFWGETDPELRCLYTDGEGWQALTGFSEMVKHIIAVRESMLRGHPELREKLLAAFRASLAYGHDHLEEIAGIFIEQYGGERDVLVASARYPKIEFTLTEMEKRIAESEMEMLLEMGYISRRISVSSVFVA